MTELEKQLDGSKYQLPDDQVKLEADEDADLPDVIRKAEDLTEQMVEVSTGTNEDGTLKGTVVGLHSARGNYTITLEVDLPGVEENELFKFDKPRVWHRRYEFVRLVESKGYSASNLTAMIEDRVKVEVRETDNDRKPYELVVPSSKYDTVKDWYHRYIRVLSDGNDDAIIQSGLGFGFITGGLSFVGMALTGDPVNGLLVGLVIGMATCMVAMLSLMLVIAWHNT